MKIKQNLKQGTWLLALCAWGSCTPTALNPSDYQRYYAEKVPTLSDHKTSGKALMTLTLQTLNLLIINDLGSTITAAQYEESKNNFCEHLYFTFDVAASTPLSTEAGKELRSYFAHDRQRQFVLVSQNDTIPCTLYHPELVNRGDKQVRINLVFPRPRVAGQACDVPLDEDLQVRFYDDKTHEYLSFLIKKENVNQLPKIKITTQ